MVMDILSSRMALVSRCPRISDGAKVTMTELLLHIDNGNNPSLNQLKRIRHVSKSTIQAHMRELVEHRILKRTIGDKNTVTYEVRDSNLLSLNGLDSMHNVGIWLRSQTASEQKEKKAATSLKKATTSLLKDPHDWDVFDAWTYFKALGMRKERPECVGLKLSAKQHSILRKLMTEIGGWHVCRIMEKFAQDHKRMGMKYTLEDLRIKKAKLLAGKWQSTS